MFMNSTVADVTGKIKNSNKNECTSEKIFFITSDVL